MRFPSFGCLLLLSLAACNTHNTAPTASTSNQNTGIVWQSCQDDTYKNWFDPRIPIPEQLQCAYLNVPANHSQANGKTFRIAITRLAADSNQAIGNLIVLAGGPGQDSLNPNMHVSNLYLPLNEQNGSSRILHNKFNIIGLAPRGITPSQPEVDCGTMIEADSRDPKIRVAACQRLSDADLLANISTNDVVEDIEQLRMALGGGKINLIGYSYGTKILAAYAQKYGQHLRAGILDGVVDTSETWFPMLTHQIQGFQRSFERFAAECSRNPNCLFSRPDRAQAEFHTFLRRIDGQNLRDKYGHPITGDKVLAAAENSLYWRQMWPHFERMMNELPHGQTQAYNELTYDLGFAPPTAEGEMPSAHWALIAVNCADYALPQNRRHNYLAQARQVDAAAPYRQYRPYSDQEQLDECYHWPHEGKDRFNAVRLPEGSPQLLLISHTEDPTTPHRNAQNMARQLNAALVSVHGDGHTLAFFGQSSCTDKTAVQYLINPQQTIGRRQCRDLKQ